MLKFVEDANGHIVGAVQVVDDEDGEADNGMTIDESERLLRNHLDGVTNYCERELTDKAIQVAIDTMKKYQKIEQIISDNDNDGRIGRQVRELVNGSN